MRKDQANTPEKALAYLTDCVMATVCDMSMRKRKPMHEYRRQISMAQFGVDRLRLFGTDMAGTRMADLTEDMDVAAWARTFEPGKEKA